MKYLVLGYYGFFNSGDDAILHAVCQDIKAIDKSCDITVMSNKPESTIEEYSDYNVNSIYRYNLLDVAKKMKKVDVVIFGGGSLLQDVTSTKSLTYYLTIMRMANMFKKKTMLYANGVGPINNIKNQKSTAKVLNKLSEITVRDSDSAKFLLSIGVDNAKVNCTADPVYNICFEDCNIDNIFERNNSKITKDFVSVYFRKFGVDVGYVQNLAEMLDEVVDKFDLDILFVPMEHGSDLALSKEIQVKMRNKACVLNDRIKVSEVFEIIDKSKFIIGMRLHSLIYASVKNKPMIAFSYDPKVDSFAKQMDISCVKFNDFNCGQVIESIDSIINNYDNEKAKLNDNYTKIKEKSLMNRSVLSELVEDSK